MNLTLKSLLALVVAVVAVTPAISAEPASAAAPAAASAPMAKGQETATQVCGACHAFDGTRGAPTFPILQGQHPDYLYKQLTEFKSNKRDNPIMAGMAAMLSDEDARTMANFYASKKAEPGAARSAEMVALGEKIYRGGINDRKIPACAGCHSPNGAGIPAQYPRLAGQHAEYTEAQLKAFRDGSRKNSIPMTGVAAKLNDREIQALADYVAGLQ
ncbi:MAG: cytochrome c [Leptothrix ochracea]|uniref:c-type cytochrome n=1 Tax=Leptothrix ochracea TaxID=735331 RepID=UPI0034E21207